MRRYAITAYDVATGAVAATYKSLLGLKAADTAGHRGRVRSITIGGYKATPQDHQVGVRLVRTDNNADGTATAVTATKLDADDEASNMTGKKNYTVEPTTLESIYLWEAGVHARGGIIKEWGPGEGPLWGKNQTLLLQATPGSTTAVSLVVGIEWDE